MSLGCLVSTYLCYAKEESRYKKTAIAIYYAHESISISDT